MLAWAAESVGLEWRPPPCPEPSRLDDWFLGVPRAGSQGPTLVPFFPEVHDELTGMLMAPFTAMKFTKSLGRAMSTMVVQECHLFAQQFSAAQKQTEAIRHILPWRAAAASTRPPEAVPRSTRRRGRPTADAPSPAQQTQQPPAKEQFPLSLGPHRGRGVVNESILSHTHPPLSPVSSCGRFERAINRTTAGTQVSASHTPTPLRTGNETPEPGPCVPPPCPTAGTLVGSLVPLVLFLGAWLALPNPSRWLRHTIRLGYAIQFARRPPKYRGVHFTSVKAVDAPILRAEIAVLLAKDAIEQVPPADMRSGFYSPYFIVPKKSGGFCASWTGPFTGSRSKCSHRNAFLGASDLKDAYFHVSILPRHRPFLLFAFEGRAYQYKVLPFGLSLSPRVFTKVAEAALVPLREQGIRILNYLDDWLILAQSRDQLCEHRDLVLSHLSQLGLQVKW